MRQKNCVIDQGKYKKFVVNGNVIIVIATINIILMLTTKVLKQFEIQPSFLNCNFVYHILNPIG